MRATQMLTSKRVSIVALMLVCGLVFGAGGHALARERWPGVFAADRGGAGDCGAKPSWTLLPDLTPVRTLECAGEVPATPVTQPAIRQTRFFERKLDQLDALLAHMDRVARAADVGVAAALDRAARIGDR